MKLIIDIDKELKSAVYNCGLFLTPTEKISLIDAINNGIPIPDNATNGEVIKTMFGVKEVDMSNTYCVHFPEEEDYSHYFFKEWWNALYQKGGKE